jgi:uncharacterized protein GlcG (DUF336 family)
MQGAPVLLGVLLFLTPLTAQGIVMQRNLSLAMARTIAEATIAECKAKGFNTSAAVVDRAGQVMVLLRDEQASAQTVEMARRKAYTARMFRTSTLSSLSAAAFPFRRGTTRLAASAVPDRARRWTMRAPEPVSPRSRIC